MNWFWHALWIALVIIPVALLWITCVASIFMRRDLSTVARVGWILVVLILPLLGSFVYLALSYKSLTSDLDAPLPGAAASNAGESSVAEQLVALSRLRDSGALTDGEFQTAKANLLGPPSGPPATVGQ